MESVETEQIETRDISPAVENTMKQMLRQMDVLTNTVRFRSSNLKVGCAFPMVFVSILSLAAWPMRSSDETAGKKHPTF